MTKRTFIVIISIAVFIIAASIGYLFHKVMLKSDFPVLSDVSCDPATEGPCYVWVCEPDWWTECTGDPDLDIWTYKVTEKMAYDIPYCDPIAKQEGFFATVTETNDCPERGLCLDTDIADCATTYCDPETEGDMCFDETKWDDYVATLRDNLVAACGNPLGDYRGSPDFCSIVEQMGAAAEEGTDESATSTDEGAPADEESAPAEEENNDF